MNVRFAQLRSFPFKLDIFDSRIAIVEEKSTPALDTGFLPDEYTGVFGFDSHYR